MHVGNGVCVVRNKAEQKGVRADLGISCLSFVGEGIEKEFPSEQDSSSYGIKEGVKRGWQAELVK